MDRRKYKILIIDDSAEERAAFRHFLQKSKEFEYHILEGELGEEGIEICLRESPDCILLDYNLPDTDGLAVIKQLITDALNPAFPIILMTGEGDEKLAVKAIKSGAQDYLVKGKITSEELVLSISKAIEIVQLRQKNRRATLALAESEDRLNSILQNANTVIYLMDEENRFAHINRHFEELFDLKAEEVRGKSLHELFPKEFADTYAANNLRVMETRQPLEAEESAIQADGVHTYLSVKVPHLDAGGNVRGVVGISTDITQRKRQEEQLRLYEKVVVNTRDAVLITEAEPYDLPGPRILYVNEAFTEMTGYTPEEVIGQTPRILQGAKTDRRQLDKIRRALENWESVRVEMTNYRKDGSEFCVEFDLSPVADENGWFTHWISIQRDVTDGKEAKEKLRVSEERLNLAMEGAQIGAFDWNIKTGAIEWTREIEEAVAMSPDDFDSSFEGFIKIVHPADREILQQCIESALKDGNYECEFRMLKGDGTIRWVIGKGSVSFDGDGQPARLVGVDIDITKRKLAENELLENQLFTQSIVETAPTVLYTFDLKTGSPTYLTSQAATFLGYSFEEVKDDQPQFLRSFMHPDDVKLVEKHFKKFSETTNGEVFEFEYRMRHKSGEWRWFRSRDRVFKRDDRGEPAEILGIALDITESKYAEEALRESAEIFRVASDAAAALVYNVDLNGRRKAITHGMESVTGYSDKEAELTAEWYHSLIHPEDLPRHLENLARQLEDGTIYKAVHRLRHKNGLWIWVEDTGKIIRDETGRAVQLVGAVVDITKRKHAEEEIKALSNYNREVLESITDPFFTLDRDWRFTYMSAQGEKMVFRQPGELLGKSLWDEFPGVAGSPFEKIYRAAMADKIVGSITDYYPDHERWYEVTIYPAPNGITVYFRDLTERKRAEMNLAFLSDLSKDFAALSSAAEIIKKAGDRITEHLNLARCVFVEIKETESEDVILHEQRAFGVPPLTAKYNRAEFYTTEELKRLADGAVISINDVRDEPRTAEAAARFEQLGIRSLATVPYNNKEHSKLFLSVQHSQPHQWREDEREMLEEFASRLWTSLERARAEEALRESEEKFRTLFDSIDEGFCVIEMIFDDHDKPLDYRFVQANPALERLTGLKDALGKTARELVSDLEDFWFETYGKVALTGEAVRFENNSETMNRWFDVYTSRIGDAASRRVAVVFNNITERKLSEKALRQSEAEFRNLANAVPQIVWVTGTNGVTQYVNEQWTEFSGLNLEETGNPEIIAAVIHPDDRELLSDAWARAYAENASFQIEARMLNHKTGVYHWFLIKGEPAKDADGNVLQWFGTSTDITDSKKAQEKLLKAERRAIRDYQNLLSRIAPLAQTLGTARDLAVIYRALLDFIKVETPCEGFFVSFYEAEHQLKRVKYVWCKGAEQEAETLETIQLFKTEGANSRAIQSGKTIITTRILNEMSSGDFQIINNEQFVVPVQTLVTPMIVMGRTIGTLEVQNHDEIYRREHAVALEMAASLAAVAIENVRLINIETEARATAEASSVAKDEFLAVLSHELRTPLNSIKGWVSMLQKNVLSDQQQTQAVEVISRNVNLQNALIEDILDVSRIISGKMRLETETISLVSILHNLIITTRPMAENKGIILETDFDPTAAEMIGDSFRLQQIINNLLNNAIKFTDSKGTVKVSLTRENDTAKLTISDTGIGIAANLLPHIFDRFQQADSTSKRKYNGLGLGLAIVKHLTELHGGTVSAASDGERKGAAFTVELPLISKTVSSLSEADYAPQPVQKKEQIKLLKDLKILLVDDDADTLEMMRVALESFGAKPACANSANNALEKLAAEKFDLLISDVGMAEIDGNDLIRQIRQNLNLSPKGLPAIALSGYVSPDDREKAKDSGFQKHLGKPVDIESLPSSILDLLQQAGRDSKTI